VLVLVAQGYSNREIAERLVLAEGTVKNHVSNLLGKLQAENRTEAAEIARRHGLI
jgi:DNA-binding NarL/FixJ family response regulator